MKYTDPKKFPVDYHQRWNPKCGRVYKVHVDSFRIVGDRPPKLVKKSKEPVVESPPEKWLEVKYLQMKVEHYVPAHSFRSRKRYIILGLNEMREVIDSVETEKRGIALYLLRELEEVYELYQ